MTAKDICTLKIIEAYRELSKHAKYTHEWDAAEVEISTQIQEWEAIIAKEKAAETLALRS